MENIAKHVTKDTSDFDTIKVFERDSNHFKNTQLVKPLIEVKQFFWVIYKIPTNYRSLTNVSNMVINSQCIVEALAKTMIFNFL